VLRTLLIVVAGAVLLAAPAAATPDDDKARVDRELAAASEDLTTATAKARNVRPFQAASALSSRPGWGRSARAASRRSCARRSRAAAGAAPAGAAGPVTGANGDDCKMSSNAPLVFGHSLERNLPMRRKWHGHSARMRHEKLK